MTVTQLVLFCIGFGWVILGALAIFRRNVDYPGYLKTRLEGWVMWHPHRLRYRGGCAFFYGVILIVCGVVIIALGWVIR